MTISRGGDPAGNHERSGGASLDLPILMGKRPNQDTKHGFMLAVAMILVTIITITGFCIHMLSERDWVAPPGHYALNSNRYWDMIGFSFFMFEGIGCVMPVMNACNEKS